MKIKRPDLSSIKYLSPSGVVCGINKWFDENVEPINKLLSEGKVIYWSGDMVDHFTVGDDCESDDTHTGLLINIEPIKPDTFEQLVRDMLENGVMTPNGVTEIRAKKLLEGKG